MLMAAFVAACGGSSSSNTHRNPTATPTTTPSATPTPIAGASVITFSPAAVALNNPTTAGVANAAVGDPSVFSFEFTAHDSTGAVLAPSADNPMTVNIYGAPEGVITPTTVTLTSTTTTNFAYNGGYFPNPITIEAWIKDPRGGAALGVTQIVGQNRLPCTSFGSQSYSVPLTSTVPDVFQIQATAGINDPTPSNFQSFTVDTGSLGTVVPLADINKADVIGPGAQGRVFYNSSGNTYSGNYYLARVTIQLANGAKVQTWPIEVLVIDKAFCFGPRTQECEKHPPSPTLHYLGVGFDRGGSTSGDLFVSPGQNAFLQLNNASGGIDVAHGYTIAQSGITLGVTSDSAAGFNMIELAPNPDVAGDWHSMPGCFAFPQLAQNPFCGSLLIDVGISGMFLDLPTDQIPNGANDNGFVPSGVQMAITAGDQSNPALSYSFSAVSPGQTPVGPAPSFAQWEDKPNIFVNTGRRPLLDFDYLYDAQCGQTGFLSTQEGAVR
jgi:hypothetical protein